MLSRTEFRRRIATARELAAPLRGGQLAFSEVGGSSGQILLHLPDGRTFYFGGAVDAESARFLTYCANLVLDQLRAETIGEPDDIAARAERTA
jgi:hypothetical protein